MRNISKTMLFSVAALSAVAALRGGQALGATIYADSFDRGSTGSPAPLLGSAPTVNPTGGAWLGSSAYTTDGTSAVLANNGVDNTAYLPVPVTAGNVYTFSATVTPGTSSNTDDWLALGFTGGTTSGFIADASAGNPAVWALVREDGETQSFFGGGTNNGAGGNNVSAGTPIRFTFTLDTTTGLSTTAFSISDSLGSIARSGTVDLVANPVNGIGISTHDSAVGTISDLTVTGPSSVPEPTSVALLGVGGLGLLARRRKH